MFIAIAPKGQEYIYRRLTRLAVPKSSAYKIADILTKNKYKLREGEVWHAYVTEYGEEMAGRARMYKGNVHIKWDGIYL